MKRIAIGEKCKRGHIRTETSYFASGGCKLCVKLLEGSDKRQAYRAKYRKDPRNILRGKKYKNGAVYRTWERSAKGRFVGLTSVAKRRGLKALLTLDEYTELVTQNCFYCKKVTYGIEAGIGLDRIDNTKGYERGNVLPCCGSCNSHKNSDWTVDEMKAAIAAVLILRQTYDSK